MRWLTISILCAALAVANVPTSSAQAQFGVVPAVLLLEDAGGDAAAGSYSNPVLTVPVSEPTADLLSLSVAETPSALLAYFGVAAIPDESNPTSSQVRTSYSLAFQYADQDFVAYISGSPPGGVAEAYLGSFCKGTWIQQETCLDGMELAVLPGPKSFGIQIPKNALGELSGVQPTMGMQIGNWRAQAQVTRPFSNDVWVGDHLNDPVVDQIAYSFQFGIAQSGQLQITGENLYVVSNGLATSYPFALNLSNSLTQAQTVRLAAKQVPAGWQITLPDAAINVAPSSTQPVVVVLTVPFRHAHGSIERFIVEAQDESGQPLASLDMGLIYTETPQPTGHHNRLSIHSFAGGQGGYVSTLAEDSGDSGEPIRGQREPSGTTLFNVSWGLSLQPALAVGLDFDPQRKGSLEVQVFTAVDTPGMQLVGNLVLEDSNGAMPLAQITSTGKVDGTAQQATTMTAEITVNPDADLVAYEPGANMVLHLTLVSDLGVWTPNDIMPGGWLTLPLFDYHDDVDAAIASLSGLSWTSELSSELRGAPDSDVVVPLTLESTMDSKRIRIQIDSSPEGIASFAGPQEAVVRPGSALSGHLVIAIPADAQNGELFNAVVIAQDQAGSGALAVYRVAVIVDQTSEPSQFNPVETPVKESPLPIWISLTVCLVAAIACRRKL